MQRISENDIVCEEMICGQPGRVEVFRVRHIMTGRILCMKKLIVNSIQEATQLQSECLAMAFLKHEHIVPLIAASICGQEKRITHILIFSEYCSQGDLDKYIARLSQSRQYLNENRILEFLRQLVSAFIFMEDKKVAHRDINPQNIFLSDDLSKVKIGDFGSALNQDQSYSNELVGTPLYLSPALRRPFLLNTGFEGVAHDVFKSDVFSLGLTFLYLTSLVPVNDLNVSEGLEYKIDQRIEGLRHHYGRVCYILKGMLSVDEHFRWDFRAIMKELNRGNTIDDRLVCENLSEMIKSYGTVRSFREKCSICYKEKREDELLMFFAGLICINCHTMFLDKIPTKLL